ncbi:hypothetical protein NKI61_18110 [Mesorhizobium sp. M0514]|uniref:hypothetical protein n=1 Tax=Mesorhizobium sp. M0514 TaxID=2956955 RepID=UPI00333728B1
MDTILDRHDYAFEGGTIHLLADIEPFKASRDAQVVISTMPSENWFDARFRMGAYGDIDRLVFRETTGLIAGERAFASSERDGEIVALAFGVIRDGLLVVESVETDGRFRQQGLGRKTVGGLIGWAGGRRFGRLPSGRRRQRARPRALCLAWVQP